MDSITTDPRILVNRDPDKKNQAFHNQLSKYSNFGQKVQFISVLWILICTRIQEVKNDPPKFFLQISLFQVLDILFWWLKASPVIQNSFKEAKG